MFALITKLLSLFKWIKTVKTTVDTVGTVVNTIKDITPTQPQEQTVEPVEPVAQEIVNDEPIKTEEPTMLTPSNACYDLIKQFEGFSSKPYKCPAGIPTIGYGSTFYADGTKVKMTDSEITKEKANEILSIVVNKFSLEVNKLIKVSLSQSQYDALVDFAYNLGTANLASSTLLKKVNAKCYTEAAEQFPRWNKAGGVVLAGLTKRRNAEKELFLS